MNADQQIALWFFATILPFCLNSLFGQRPDAVGISGMLVVGWGFERLCWVIWTPPAAMQLYAPMDLAFGLTCLIAWLSRPAWWKILLVADFIVQLCLHTVFWRDPSPAAFSPYVRVNNLCYLLELCIAASPGVGNALAILGRLGQPDHSRLRPHAGP